MLNIDKEKVSKYELFQRLNDEELDKVLSCCNEMTCQPGQVIIQESILGPKIYLILKGQASVEIEFKNMPGSQAIATLGEGDFFGEYCFLEDKPRTAQVTAVDEVQILKIDNQALNGLMEEDHHIGYLVCRNLATVLSQRLFETNIKLRDKE